MSIRQEALREGEVSQFDVVRQTYARPMDDIDQPALGLNQRLLSARAEDFHCDRVGKLVARSE